MRYLVSLYFDESSNEKLNKYITQIAKKTENQYMLDKKIPPHLTIGMVECDDEQKAIQIVEGMVKQLKRGLIEAVAIGAFKPHVLYLSILHNGYLNQLSITANDYLDTYGINHPDSMYKPNNHLAHITLARKLNDEQMLQGFHYLLTHFEPFDIEVKQIGLAKCNPHEDIQIWEVNKE